MSTDNNSLVQPLSPVGEPLELRDVAALLVKHYGLSEGMFDLMLEYQIGVGPVGPNKENLVPGAMVGVSRLGLVPAQKIGPTTVDAAKVNPVKQRRDRVAKK